MKKLAHLPLCLSLGLCLTLGACTGSIASEQANSEEAANRGIIESEKDLVFAPEEAMSLRGAFTGQAYLRKLIANEDVYHFPQTNLITFEPGARSHWHTHGGMVILVTDGVGYYQEEGKPAQIIRRGDIIESPAGVKHWHGAAPDSWFSQIVIYDASYQGDGQTQEVTDEEYAALEAEEYTGRTVTDEDLTMFMSGRRPMQMDTFSGPIYLSDLLGSPNVAGTPGLHYVVFDPSVINNWHTHEGGQILIATDGIGFHQMENGEVEVLYPGDVAFCPPGVMHWHGASAGTMFAHIAVNTNPEQTGLTWAKRISEEEYASLQALIEEP